MQNRGKGHTTVRHLLSADTRDERLGWRLHQSWALPRFVEEAGTPLVTDPETLAALLDERLAARAKTQKRAPRRRKRSPSTGDRP